MLTMTYASFACYTLGLAVLYVALGVVIGVWWTRPPMDVWERRTSRDLDESRYREGAPYDGQFRGVSWLTNHHEAED